MMGILSTAIFKVGKTLEQSTGEHFNKPGHTMADMKISILEKIKSQDPQLRKIRESLFIQKFNTSYKRLEQKVLKVLIAKIIFFFLSFWY